MRADERGNIAGSPALRTHRQTFRQGVDDAAWRQIEIHRQAETQGGAYRGRLRKTRRAAQESGAARLGDRQPRKRWRQEKRLGTRQAGVPRLVAQGRLAGRESSGGAAAGGMLAFGRKNTRNAQTGVRQARIVAVIRQRPLLMESAARARLRSLQDGLTTAQKA